MVPLPCKNGENMRHISMIFAILLAMSLHAQELTIAQNLEDFDFAVNEVEVSYAGFPTYVNDTTKADYDNMVKHLRDEIEQGKIEGWDAVARYFGWFGDCHLRLPQATPEETYKYFPERKQVRYKTLMECYEPKKLSCKVTDKTYLIRFPSCVGIDPDNEWVMQSIRDFWTSGCDNLIIDIRGNNGGSDETYKPYLALLYDHAAMMPNVEVRKSPGNIAFWESKVQQLPFAAQMLERAKTSDDEFVLLLSNEREFIIEQPQILERPIKAALIFDQSVASSGEDMVLEIKATSNRTTTYAQDNTRGVIDFANLRTDTYLPNSNKRIFIPTTRSCALPERSIDVAGIEPDVRITLPLPKTLTDNVDDWVAWVATDLEK